MKYFVLFLMTAMAGSLSAQVAESEKFWQNLQQHCGKSYEGKITAGAKEGDGFTGEKLVMHVLSCEPGRIRIPFYVGADRSRTWVLTKNEDQIITLKHDHRHRDGSEEEVTQYGGQSANQGFAHLQMFPADRQTASSIPYASTNVWWMTLTDSTFSYNLHRIGSDRLFTVEFDLTKPVQSSARPWGWQD